jgi:hypothetical protein
MMTRERLAAKLHEIMRDWWKGADYPLFNDDPAEGFRKIAEWLEAEQPSLSVYRIERTTLPGPHERKGWVWSWEVLATSPEAALAEIPDHHQNGATVCGVEPAAFPMVIHTGLRRPAK